MPHLDPVDLDWHRRDLAEEREDALSDARAVLRDKCCDKLKGEVLKAFADGANAVLTAPRHTGGTTDMAAVISDYLGTIPEVSERNTALVSIIGRACAVPGPLGDDARAFAEAVAADHAEWNADALADRAGEKRHG